MEDNELNNAEPGQPEPVPEDGAAPAEDWLTEADSGVPAADQPAPGPARLRLLRRRQARHEWKFPQAFWTVACVFSLAVNVVLIALLLAIGQQLFTIKGVVEDQLLGGLFQNFVMMDQAHIRTSIPISTSVPAKFDLPLKTNTIVVLTEDTTLENATVARLTTGGLTIENAPATIVLRTGTELPVALDLTVPVDQVIPVTLTVDVDIPLNKTDLHKPFVGLQEVVRPYYRMLSKTPGSWNELICGEQPEGLCRWFFDRSGN